MFAFIKGTSPLLAVEMGRRAVPNHVRPSFQEVEKACRSAAAAAKGAQTEAAAPAPASG
jgi:chemotaxis protein MotA